MKKIFLALAAVAAVSAAPVSADWDFLPPNNCGGTSFSTCISGSVMVSGLSLVVNITNIGPGTITGVGLWNLPAGVLPNSASTALTGWNGGGTNDINGVVPDNKTRYAIGTTNGINDGLAAGAPQATFAFYFDSGTDMSLVDDVGLGIHSQGVGTCSTKLYLQDGSVSNPNAPGSLSNCVSVPEPSSMALLATGLAGLAFVGRRRRGELEEEDEA